jgi:tetratricopeptide (TPR) repeat protein
LDEAPGDSEARLVLAQAHTQIGGYQDLSGQLADALKTLQTALDLTARQRPPAHAPWRYWQVVLNTHRILGNVYLQKGDRERAMRSYRAARAIAERMSVEDPANLNWRSDLARCQARIGVTQALNGEYTAAIDAYRSAVEVYRTLRGVDPTNRKWRTNLSLTLVTMGQVQTRAGHLEAALASYAQARVALNELASQDPANNFARKLLQELESSVGEVQWKLGQKRLALEAYLTERTMLSPLIKRDPEDRNLILLLALNHARVGHCYADRGDAINARNEWQSALTLSERLLAEPSQDFVRYIRGWALLGLGRIPEAKASLEGLRLPFEPSDFRLLDLMRKTGLKVGKK